MLSGLPDGGETREMELTEFLLLLGAILFTQGSQEVEGGLGWRRVRRIGGQTFDFEMALAVLHGDGSRAQVLVVEIELDATEIEGIKVKLERASGQGGVDLVDVALKSDGGIAAHLAFFTPQEGQAQRFRVGGTHVVETGGIARQGGLLGFTVFVEMIDAFQPGPQRLVEVGQGRDMGDFDLGQELSAQGGEEAFLLSLGLHRQLHLNGTVR